MNRTFLILDDNDVFASTLARSLARRGFSASVAHSGAQALAVATRTAFDYVTIDLQLQQDSGLQWIAPLRRQLPQARLLVLTGYASIATTVLAMKAGADNYLAKPANLDSILSALAHGAAAADAVAEAAPGGDGNGNDKAGLAFGMTGTPLSVERLEWEHIQRVLLEHQGNISSTARALNMHRRTLQRKLSKRPVAK